ncbi:MAG: (2Fe-2S)-binding protein [Cetobacterium sp.]|uniref:(2Fe-2S)-binding protein n=1 Tax=Cetobacterium sp. TaxID=2071632 RepID=UPI003F38AC00
MAANTIICHCKNVDYITIRMAMVKGARTLEEIKEMTGAGTGCGRCKVLVQDIIERKY